MNVHRQYSFDGSADVFSPEQQADMDAALAAARANPGGRTIRALSVYARLERQGKVRTEPVGRGRGRYYIAWPA